MGAPEGELEGRIKPLARLSSMYSSRAFVSFGERL
jgi:hypothetical protein